MRTTRKKSPLPNGPFGIGDSAASLSLHEDGLRAAQHPEGARSRQEEAGEWAALAQSRDRYMDLFTFAPVGYLTLTGGTLIAEINLTGMGLLLGGVRGRVLGRQLGRFVAPADRERYEGMIGRVIEHGNHETCALAIKRADDSLVHVQLDGLLAVSVDEPRSVRITMTDMTERRNAEAAIETLAFYDSLTGLANRRLLHDRLEQAIQLSTRTGRYGAILFLDLDHFKQLNDTHGHAAGDLLLQQAAMRLLGCVRASDTVARLGGDEFVIMLEELSSTREGAVAQARAVGAKTLATLATPYRLGATEYSGTASVGVMLFQRTQQSAQKAIESADAALYGAKRRGGGRLSFSFKDAASRLIEDEPRGDTDCS